MDNNDSNMRSEHNHNGHDCCGWNNSQSRARHIVIRILVALFIFWCGVQFGELKAMLHSGYEGYGRNMMWHSQSQAFPANFGAPVMMYGSAQVTQPPAPTTVK